MSLEKCQNDLVFLGHVQTERYLPRQLIVSSATKAQIKAISDRCNKEGINIKEFTEAFGISSKETSKKQAESFVKTLDNKIMQFIGAPDES